MPQKIYYKTPAFITDPVARKKNFLMAHYRKFLVDNLIGDYKSLFLNEPINTRERDAIRSKLNYYATELIIMMGRNKFLTIKDQLYPGADREAKQKVINYVNYKRDLPLGVDWEGIYNPPTNPPQQKYINPFEQENEQKLHEWRTAYWDKHFDELLNKK